MKLIKREQYNNIWKKLSAEKRMIFLAGPRQTGKTTLTKEIAKEYKNNLYFNWDIILNKRKLIENPVFFEELNRVDDSLPLIIFDEIHKYKNWKNYLKGIYDDFFNDYLFLISGSGRLDLYQKGGDSLAGRYLLFHLFPFTLSELSRKNRKLGNFLKNPLKNFKINDEKISKKIWNNLEKFSGFPEPYTKGKKSFWTNWTRIYSKQIIYEDIRDMANIKNVDLVGILYSLLPSKIGSPFSINSLAQDLQVSFDTVKNWLSLFDNAYLSFYIFPWTQKISRAILKEKKIYLFNYPLISDLGARFENMAALELYKAINNWNDLGQGNFALNYVRNKEKEEVDFLISQNNKPVLLVETKMKDTQTAKNLINFQNKLNVPAVQLVNVNNIFRLQSNGDNKILVVSASDWLSSLPKY